MAWWGAVRTFLDYLGRYGHHSYDNDDGELEVYVHAHLGVDEPNARGDANCGIEFSTGMTGIDITAHEFTHMVIGEFSDLDYNGESGALAESLCDIAGIMVDLDDWLIGEDFTGGFGVARDVSNPQS